MADDELYEKGIAIREEMLGPEHGRAKVESQPDFTRDFEELVTRYCFGSVWSRDQISRIPAAVEGFRNASAVLAELGME
jgi:alkylhydroperoxidase/carboxymuconolactone decarboxylase family protein YurZ